MSRIVVIGALPESLLIFRGDLLKAMVSAGHEVTAMAAQTDPEVVRQLAEFGVGFNAYPVQRGGMNPAVDIQTCVALRKALRQIMPDIVLAYTIKPVIWGGLALSSMDAPARFYALITGLGFTFQPGGLRQKALTELVTRLYRWALVRAHKVIFQNVDNQRAFVYRKVVDFQQSLVVSGSGVNLNHFLLSTLPQGNIVFLTIARLLGAKGLREYAQAAQRVSGQHPDVTFRLVGPEDLSPDGLPLSEVQNWQVSGTLQYMGAAADVRPFIQQCHVYVLASYHEGMPRTILEAMAMGRPIITTDAPGCRETVPLTKKGLIQRANEEPVMEGENGFLVRMRDSPALAQAMKIFIQQPGLIEAMGRRSREIAEEKYDVHKINQVMLDVMGLQ